MNIERPTPNTEGRTERAQSPVLSPQSFLLLLLALLLLVGCSRPAAPAFQSRFFARAEIIGDRGVGLGQFLKPRSVIVDAHDNVYAVDITARVQKFDPCGKLLLFWQALLIDQEGPKGMAVDHDGNVILLESHARTDIVNVFSPGGGTLRAWGVAGTALGEFDSPRNVAVDRAGNLFVCESGSMQRIQVIDPRGGKPIRHWGGPGNEPGQFSRPEGMAFDRDGNLWVADACNHRLQEFTPDGRFLRSMGRAGVGPGELSYPYDVKIDSQGVIFVCEYGNSRIQAFDATGRSLECLGGPGTAPGQFNNPWSIAFNSRGDLYVADGRNNRVVKLVRKD